MDLALNNQQGWYTIKSNQPTNHSYNRRCVIFLWFVSFYFLLLLLLFWAVNPFQNLVLRFCVQSFCILFQWHSSFWLVFSVLSVINSFLQEDYQCRYIYPTRTPKSALDTRSINKWSKSGLNSEFFFSKTGCLTKAKEPSLELERNQIDTYLSQ